MFVDPTTKLLEMSSVAVGIVAAETHTAATASAQVLDLLKTRCNVGAEMIVSVGVDTTNSALAAAKLVKDKGDGEEQDPDKCRMHVSSLMTGHSMGIKTRSKDKVECDQFPAAKTIRIAARAFL